MNTAQVGKAGGGVPGGFSPGADDFTKQGWVDLLDGVLRRREAYFEEIFSGRDMAKTVRWFLLVIVSLSAFYGLTMGAMGWGEGFRRGAMQMVASAVKVPLLYLLSVLVCYPVLFVVIVLMGSRLSFTQTLTLILLALTLNSVLLASCAPIVWFFMFTGADYNFIKLLHVAIFGFSGAWAMMALWQGLRMMCEKSDLYPKQAVRILQVWILVFGFVGTQMAWSLRPFVGAPGRPFSIVRHEQEGNFYKAVWASIIHLGS